MREGTWYWRLWWWVMYKGPYQINWWWKRTTEGLRWWYCNQTGGHKWLGTMVKQLPAKGDTLDFMAFTMCVRCKLSLYNRHSITGLQEYSANFDIIEFTKDRLTREILAATAHRAVPIYRDFHEWISSDPARRLS